MKKRGREALPVLTRPTYVTAVLAVNCYGMIVAKCVLDGGCMYTGELRFEHTSNNDK
jgi:hypothetical protein